MLPLLAAPSLLAVPLVLAAVTGLTGVTPPSGVAPPSASAPQSAVSAPPSPQAAVRVAWGAPVPRPLVLQAYDPPARDWLPGHRGVDLVADPGDPVRSAGPGTVTWAGPLAGRGVVVVSHPDGRRTTYEPVEADVLVGEQVDAGDLLGRLSTGAGHCGGVPSCLHWGLRRGEDYLDPMLLLRRGRPVLLP